MSHSPRSPHGQRTLDGRSSAPSSLREFSPQHVDIEFDTHRQAVIVSADALLFWWGGDAGPQTAPGLIDQHIEDIRSAVIARIAAGAACDAPIEIGEDDLD